MKSNQREWFNHTKQMRKSKVSKVLLKKFYNLCLTDVSSLVPDHGLFVKYYVFFISKTFQADP